MNGLANLLAAQNGPQTKDLLRGAFDRAVTQPAAQNAAQPEPEPWYKKLEFLISNPEGEDPVNSAARRGQFAGGLAEMAEGLSTLGGGRISDIRAFGAPYRGPVAPNVDPGQQGLAQLLAYIAAGGRR